ncbi:MAG TPA: superoxide dismutase family protein [Candidatus Sulfotelmatobacter sp.]
MKRLQPLCLLFAPILVVVIALPATAKNTVELKDAKGNSAGTVIISQKGSGVVLQLRLHDLPPGGHAIHFHNVAKCDAPDFKSAGPHFNPGKKKHGFDNPDGHHAGDMKNFVVDTKGRAKTKVTDAEVTLGSGSDSLFSNGGTAIVIHAKGDDYKTDPSGNSGDRIACGVITK